jgi:hypothetical protein
VTGVGHTLRSARERLGQSLASVSDATGISVEDLERIEGEPPAGPDAADRAVVERYAAHLGLDAALLADEARTASSDAGADTRVIPVAAPAKRRDPAIVWIAAGAVAGIAGLAFLGGGFGSGGGDTGSKVVITTAARTAQAAGPAAATIRPVPSTQPAIELRLSARPGKTVWVEVRRGGASGKPVFAGIVGGGTTKRFTSDRPLWLGVAWAPNVVVTVNGEQVDAPGGTESYLVTAGGLRRFTPA